MNALLKKFKEDFERKTKVKVYEATIGVGNWHQLLIEPIDYEGMINIAKFTFDTFRQDGSYRHVLPKIRGTEGNCLVYFVQDDVLKEIYENI